MVVSSSAPQSAFLIFSGYDSSKVFQDDGIHKMQPW